MIADVLGKSPSMISKVIHGNANSLSIAQAIAKVLGKPLTEVFPARYDYCGSRCQKDSNQYLLKLRELTNLLNSD